MEIYSRLEDKHSGETHYGAITHTQRDTRPKIDTSFCVRLSILIKRAVSLLLPAARHTLSLLYLFSSTIYCQSGGTIQEKFPMSRACGRALNAKGVVDVPPGDILERHKHTDGRGRKCVRSNIHKSPRRPTTPSTQRALCRTPISKRVGKSWPDSSA